jgi:hypothetical protein
MVLVMPHVEVGGFRKHPYNLATFHHGVSTQSPIPLGGPAG